MHSYFIKILTGPYYHKNATVKKWVALKIIVNTFWSGVKIWRPLECFGIEEATHDIKRHLANMGRWEIEKLQNCSIMPDCLCEEWCRYCESTKINNQNNTFFDNPIQENDYCCIFYIKSFNSPPFCLNSERFSTWTGKGQRNQI